MLTCIIAEPILDIVLQITARMVLENQCDLRLFPIIAHTEKVDNERVRVLVEVRLHT